MDLNRNAFRIVQSLTDITENKTIISKRQVAARLGGVAGGPARAKKLTSAERRAIAVKASRARWKNNGLASKGA
jgi:hypothetical protein